MPASLPPAGTAGEVTAAPRATLRPEGRSERVVGGLPLQNGTEGLRTIDGQQSEGVAPATAGGRTRSE